MRGDGRFSQRWSHIDQSNVHKIYIIYYVYFRITKGNVTVTYSVDRRSEEEQAYVFFGDFLDDCEGKLSA